MKKVAIILLLVLLTACSSIKVKFNPTDKEFDFDYKNFNQKKAGSITYVNPTTQEELTWNYNTDTSQALNPVINQMLDKMDQLFKAYAAEKERAHKAEMQALEAQLK